MTDVPPRKRPDPAEVRAAVLAVADWLVDESAPTPSRPALAAAVRLTARTLEHLAPGNSVEVRVPPFVAVQCIEGPRHTRGTPPNVVETSPRTWLLMVTGLRTYDAALGAGELDASGHRADLVAEPLPLVPLGPGPWRSR
ncbi:sterol carrier family protein [Gordonia sp. C13]|uniref:sterol carrier family protein n=1 Tax=Gordonia sp. C13 TaxID=2935078 RepID=UPI00200B365D|nr:sterol carrier family protein [Gordonia sp. C13]MCK8616100.1 sterol carrier family protein [Gordonia sp. C13]